MWGCVSPLNTEISALFLNMSQAVDQDILKKIEIPSYVFHQSWTQLFSFSPLTPPSHNIIIYIFYFKRCNIIEQFDI